MRSKVSSSISMPFSNTKKLFNIKIICLIISFSFVLNQLSEQSRLMRLPLRIEKGSVDEDLKKANEMIKGIHGTQKFHYSGIYKLALTQDRNKIAYFTQLILGDDKTPLEFMIDTGIRLIKNIRFRVALDYGFRL